MIAIPPPPVMVQIEQRAPLDTFTMLYPAQLAELHARNRQLHDDYSSGNLSDKDFEKETERVQQAIAFLELGLVQDEVR